MKPLKTFYSYGQNQNGRWDVCLVDFWDEEKTSMMEIDQFDTKEEAMELANRLERQRIEKELK